MAGPGGGPAGPFGDKLSLWQGDITRLAVDAIVNAANSQLLGCFVPGHNCIDNVIHSAAGLQLREACYQQMKQQHAPEPTGQAKITAAYNLPSKYVIHTVGPIVTARLTPELEQDLANSYRACLEIAVANQVRSLAFCCISTGVFRFPNQAAAAIAIATVRAFLEAHAENLSGLFLMCFWIKILLFTNFVNLVSREYNGPIEINGPQKLKNGLKRSGKMHDIWNPWHGCTKISEGYDHCYMYYLDRKNNRNGADIYRTKAGFNLPVQKDRQRRYKIKSGELIRVCMTSDFFLEAADPWREEAWQIIRERSDVKFFLLTKRPERVKDCLPQNWGDGWENVFFNVTCENQKRADERIPMLLELPFKHKGIMCAPFIGAIQIEKYLDKGQD